MEKIKELKRIAYELRLDALNAICGVKSGHPGGSLSCAEIVTALYFYKMKVDPSNPQWEDRDRFVLSKGHAAPLVYAALARKGYFDPADLKRLRQVDCHLQGAVSVETPGCDVTTGPLGIGLSASVGIALGLRYTGNPAHVYCVLGDGEIQEGNIWEAVMSAPKFRLGNLVAILDHNKVQQGGTVDEIMPLLDVEEKFRSFGWNVKRIDGHDMEQILAVLDAVEDQPTGTPTMIIADTVKGKGVSYMEGNYKWHSGHPEGDAYDQAVKELKEGMEQ